MNATNDMKESMLEFSRTYFAEPESRVDKAGYAPGGSMGNLWGPKCSPGALRRAIGFSFSPGTLGSAGVSRSLLHLWRAEGALGRKLEEQVRASCFWERAPACSKPKPRLTQ